MQQLLKLPKSLCINLKNRHFFAVGLAGGIQFFMASFFVTAQAETVYVQVRSTQIRAEPVYWSRGLVTVKHGQAVDVVDSMSDGWLKVVVPSNKQQGFLPVSSVTSRSVLISTSGLSTSKGSKSPQSREDIVLAGKGLNSEIEREMARSSQRMNFAAVDRLDAFVVKGSDLASFVQAGRLARASYKP